MKHRQDSAIPFVSYAGFSLWPLWNNAICDIEHFDSPLYRNEPISRAKEMRCIPSMWPYQVPSRFAVSQHHHCSLPTLVLRRELEGKVS